MLTLHDTNEELAENHPIRVILLVAMVALIAFTIGCFKVSTMFYYLTNWTMMLQTYSIYVTITTVSNPNTKNDLNKIAHHHFFYTCCIIFNSVVTSIYWTLIHHVSMKQYEGQTARIVQQYLSHSVPAMVCLINTLITQTVMTSSLLIPLQVVAVIYNFINFCQTKIGGKPIYDFMTWDPIQNTAGFVIVLIGVFSAFYVLLCKMD